MTRSTRAEADASRSDACCEDGQSALLLVESLIHALIAARTIDRVQAIEIVNIAVDVKLEVASHRGDNPLEAASSARSLFAIESSLRIEQPPATS